MVAPSEPGSGFSADVEILVVRWSHPSSGRAIVSARTDDVTEVTLAGFVGFARPGDRVRVEGRWTTHSRFGRQVQVTSAAPLDPTGERAVRRLLQSAGLGAASSRRLWEAHGDQVLELMDRDAGALLTSLPRMPADRARVIADTWQDKRAFRGLYLLLAEHGLLRLLGRLRQAFGDDPLPTLRADPWLLVRFRGVGLPDADAVASHLGVALTHPGRDRGALVCALHALATQGHTCAPVDQVLWDTRRRAGDHVDAGALEAAATDGLIASAGGYVWESSAARHELVCAQRVAALLGAPAPSVIDMPNDPVGSLTTQQWLGVRRAFGAGVSVVCGGPGTGKTFLVRAIARIAQAANWEVALCAPTGRAARRITQSTGLPALTAHRLLEWNRNDGRAGPARDANYPLDVDLLLVDEASMLDNALAAAVLAATRDGTRVIFVGDPDQLPSVAPGRFLADLIASEVVPVTRLTVVHRQAQRSQIVHAAHAINRGELPTGASLDGPGVLRDFFWMPESNPSRLRQLVVDLVAQRLPAFYDLDPLRDILVMAPAKKGPVGVRELNDALARRLNPDGRPIPASRLRVGDKAMWVANDEALDLANGMMLLVEDYDERERVVVVRDEDERVMSIPADRLQDLVPGFVVTAHKSQGGEAPVALTVLHPTQTNPRLLMREMLYTAVTRARQASIVAGDLGAYRLCVSQVGAMRTTGLVAALRAACAPLAAAA